MTNKPHKRSYPPELQAPWKSRFAAPSEAKRGEIINIRTLIAHPMESGFRSDNQGEAIPRNIIQTFECYYSNTLEFCAEFFPAIAANPYLAFEIVARESGEIACYWTDQQGRWATATHNLNVL